MGASLRVAGRHAYRLHEVTTAAGSTVREYASPSGVVFGVTWHGPGLPDMRQLLGSSFTRHQQALRLRRAHRQPLLLDEPDLDWGLPFFYGRRVFLAFEEQSTSAGAGPYLGF